MSNELNGPTEVQRITAPESPSATETSEFVGELHFENEYPTRETVEKLYDELDFQRACQVFLRNMMGLSMYAFREGLVRDLGVDSPRKFAIFEGRMDANSLFLTPNTETVYGVTFLDTKADGPTVVDVPPAVLGLLNDMWMRAVEDIGIIGPDQGKGGKYLVLPPGFEGDVPEGYYVLRPKTYSSWFVLRGMLTPDGDAGPAVANMKGLRIYPLSEADSPPDMTFVNGIGRPIDTIHPVDIRYFEELARLVGEEHEDALDPETAGLLACIGIENGREFAPDARMRRILTDAARVAGTMAAIGSYAPRLDLDRYPDRTWLEAARMGYPTFEKDGRTLLDGMAAMAWWATGAAKGMVTPKPGTGSAYMWTFTDSDGEWLSGDTTYRLHLPKGVPAANFWSLVVYDVWTRSMLANGQDYPSRTSYDPELVSNDDGSVDLYFGPTPPEGMASNWVRTVPGKGWFVVLRLYGPLEEYFDKSWKPSDIEPVG